MNMNLTNYNPNNDRGITDQAGISGIRCLDGEDLCKLQSIVQNEVAILIHQLTLANSEGTEREASKATAKGVD